MRKHLLPLLISLFLLIVCVGSITFFVTRDLYGPDSSPTTRITNILDEHGDLLRSIASQNTTSVSGAVTVQVDTLQGTVAVGSAPVSFRNNTGALEFSHDGSTWIPALGLPYTSHTTYTVGQGTATGNVRLLMGDDDILKYDTDTNTLTYWNGADWQALGGGIGGFGYGEALVGDGTTILASQSFLSGIPFDIETTHFTMSFRVLLNDFPSNLGKDTVLYSREVAGYDLPLEQFGIESSNNALYYKVWYDTTTTWAEVMYTDTRSLDSTHLLRWVDLEMAADLTSDIVFCIGGECSAAVSATQSFEVNSIEENTFKLCSSLDGMISWFSRGRGQLFPASSYHSPHPAWMHWPRGYFLFDFRDRIDPGARDYTVTPGDILNSLGDPNYPLDFESVASDNWTTIRFENLYATKQGGGPS